MNWNKIPLSHKIATIIAGIAAIISIAFCALEFFLM